MKIYRGEVLLRRFGWFMRQFIPVMRQFPARLRQKT
jgi:hypothetical protein